MLVTVVWVWSCQLTLVVFVVCILSLKALSAIGTLISSFDGMHVSFVNLKTYTLLRVCDVLFSEKILGWAAVMYVHVHGCVCVCMCVYSFTWSFYGFCSGGILPGKIKKKKWFLNYPPPPPPCNEVWRVYLNQVVCLSFDLVSWS